MVVLSAFCHEVGFFIRFNISNQVKADKNPESKLLLECGYISILVLNIFYCNKEGNFALFVINQTTNTNYILLVVSFFAIFPSPILSLLILSVAILDFSILWLDILSADIL